MEGVPVTTPFRRRLDAVAKAMPHDRIKRAESLAEEMEADTRIRTWTATAEDFQAYFAPVLDDIQAELLAAAVKHHTWVLNGQSCQDEWRVPLLGAAAVDHEPGSPRQLEAIATLQRYAEPPSREARDETHLDALDSVWLSANRYLVALGDDHGAALHEKVAPLLREARERWDQQRVELAEIIAAGSDRRVHFYLWVQPDLQERRDALLARALQVRRGREAGETHEFYGLHDLAAEVVSYLPDEQVPDRPQWILRIARDQHPAPGTPSHEERVEANELHWVLGPDGGTTMRERMKAMTKEGSPTTS